MFPMRFVGQLLSKFQVLNRVTCVSSVSTLQRPVINTPSSWQHNTGMTRQESSSTLLHNNPSTPLYNLESVRTIQRIHYRPNALKRIKKHGMEKRLSSRSQREILFRRIINGRHSLTVFDRFMNLVPEQKKKGTKRVNLFDPKKGFKSAFKPTEYYRF